MVKEHYGKRWVHAYRKVDGKRQEVLVQKHRDQPEEIKIPSKEYIRKHYPMGSWDS